MPIYEYRRPDGSTFEVLQSFSDDALTHDPDTGVEVQRVLHAPAVHFKGSGFYNTDYGTKRRQRESAASSEGSGSSESSSSDASGGASSDGSGGGKKSESGGKPAESSGGKSGSKPKSQTAAAA